MPRRSVLVALFLAVLLTVGVLSRAATQDNDGGVSTPAASPIGTPAEILVDTSLALPITPRRSECTAQRKRSLEDLLARIENSTGTGSDASAETAIIATPEVFTLPEGEPADTPGVVGVTGTLRQVIACRNTGNPLIMYDFTTDQFLRHQLPILAQSEAMAEATPASTKAQVASLMAVRNVTLLPDGRVGALVETLFPDEMASVQVDYYFFIEEDAIWLIDDIVEDLEGQYPPTTSPADVADIARTPTETPMAAAATPQPTHTPTATPTRTPTATPEPTQTATASTAFQTGAVVAVVGDAVNLRAGAGITESVVATLPLGTVLTVTGPAEAADGYVWWPVVTETGQGGFVAEQFLTIA